jgi:hypothetical protein
MNAAQARPQSQAGPGEAAQGQARAVSSVFVVGAPRCGTTSLSKTLASHPQVCFSKPKETHFFARAEDSLDAAALHEQFLHRYYVHADTEGKVLAEGSVSTLYAPEAIRRILRFDPEARFLVMLRNPVDMIHSYHARLLYSLDEDVEDFARAWALQGARARGEQLPARCRAPMLLQYGNIGSLGRHLETLIDIAGRERCLPMLLDDVKQRPAELYGEMLDFLGLDDDGRGGFVHKNENFAYRSRWLQQFVMNPPPAVTRFIMAREKRGLDRMGWLRALRKRIKKRNKVRAGRPQMDAELRRMLAAYFHDDVQRLSRLLGRDLSHWQ